MSNQPGIVESWSVLSLLCTISLLAWSGVGVIALLRAIERGLQQTQRQSATCSPSPNTVSNVSTLEVVMQVVQSIQPAMRRPPDQAAFASVRQSVALLAAIPPEVLTEGSYSFRDWQGPVSAEQVIEELLNTLLVLRVAVQNHRAAHSVHKEGA